jgi:hypothetical protein
MKTFIFGFIIGALVIIAGLLGYNRFILSPAVNVQTNIIHGTQIDYFTNAVQMTNYLNITNLEILTNIVMIFTDYEAYSTDNFVFTQSNDNLQVRLYKRMAGIKLEPWQQDKKNMISLFYPLGVSYSRMVYDNQHVDLWAGIGFNFSTTNIFAQVGAAF